jgi:hypothetical protein
VFLQACVTRKVDFADWLPELKSKRWISATAPTFSTHVVPILLLATLVVVFTQLRMLQWLETQFAALILAFVMFPDASVPPGTDVVVFGITGGQTLGIRMTFQNSAAILSMPLVLTTAAIVWLRPAQTRAALTSLAAAIGVLIIENQVRFLVAAIISDNVSGSYRISVGAIVFGSMLTVLCMASAVLTYVLILVKRSRSAAASGAAK